MGVQITTSKRFSDPSSTVLVPTSTTYAFIFGDPEQIAAIYNNGNLSFQRLSQVWENISDSITTYIRENGAANFSDPVIGQTYHESACMHVRWPFIAYPASLVFLTIIFLTAVILETHRGSRRSHDWKSSPLALLFHGLEQNVDEKRNRAELTQTKDMDDVARKLSVRLSQTENGWSFVPHEITGVKGSKGGMEIYLPLEVDDGD